MKHTPIRRISAKKKQQILDEVRIRIALCQRARGTWIVASSLTGGYCVKALCEECGGKPDAPDFILKPHEKVFRSQGGVISLDNSVMLCNKCASKAHGIKVVESEPMWSRDDK